MKPFYKYTGGKTKEMKNISNFFPTDTKRVIEPFCGSCSTAFNFELPSIVSDTDDDVTNLLQVVKDRTSFDLLMNMVNSTNIDAEKTEKNTKHLEKIYYDYRDNYYLTDNNIYKAYRFLLLRQLCFSGMTRVNSKTGKSNVPYGWYGFFNTRLDENYHKLLQFWEIKNQSFEITINSDLKKDDWIFIDPPYYQRNSKYNVDSNAGESEELHIKLFNSLKNTEVKWLLIHSDCNLYQDLYKDYNISINNFRYSQNFKGKEIKNAKVDHLYITNY